MLLELSRRGLGAVWILLSMGTAFNLDAATISRGPYLQQNTPSSITIAWRTSNATSGWVRYGTNAADFVSTNSDGIATNQHWIKITDLAPATKYFYEVGASNQWFPGSTNQYFITAPLVGSPQPTRLWVIGDSGDPSADARAVRDSYAAHGQGRPTDLWLMLGDNAYDGGADTEYQAAVFDMYPQFLRNTPLWPTVGNHDRDPVYFDIFHLPKNGEVGGVPSGTESYYSFDYANIHFVCLDSARADRSTNGAMYRWLETDLAAQTQDWLIAYWHHPPYSHGTHNSDSEIELIEMRQTFVPLLEHYGVDLVLNGHSHGYERSWFMDGHYGSSSTFTASMKKVPGNGRENGDGAYVKPAGEGNEGAVYTVAGNGAMASDPSPHPAIYTSSGEVGSLVIDIVGHRLDLLFLLATGTNGDSFTIIKEPAVTSPPAAPTNLVATGLATNRIALAWSDTSTNESDFRIERSTNGLAFVQVAIVPANTTNAEDIGLSPGRTYYYRLRAHNSLGNSPYSDMAQATTLTPPPPPPDDTPPGAITNLAVIAVTSNAATLRWRVPGDDGYTGTAARYDLRFRTSPLAESNWAGATLVTNLPVPLAAGTTQSLVVTGLAAATTYYFGLKAADESNNVSLLSNVASATTVDTVPPGAVTNLQVVGITSNSVTLAWTAPGDDGYLGRANSYDLRRRTNMITDSNWSSSTTISGEPTPAVVGTAQSFTVTGLSAGVTWFFALKASDDSNNVSQLSNLASATTALPADTTPPGAITNLAVIAVTSNAVTLRWRVPGDDGYTGTAARYDLRFSTSPLAESNWTGATLVTNLPVPTAAGTTQSLVVTGLAAATTYYFGLKASDESNNVSLLSNVASATTVDTVPPGAVTNLQVVAVTSNSVTLAWTAPGDDGYLGRASGYDLRRRTNMITDSNWSSSTTISGEPVPAAAGTTQSFTVTGLSTGITYFFALKSSDDSNNVSQLSNVASATPSLPDITPPGAITNLAVIAVSSNQVTLRWKAPGDDGYTGTAARYDLRFSTSPLAESNWTGATLVTNLPVPTAAGATQSLVVTGLAAATTYYFGLKASDESNNVSLLSNVASATTVDTVPPAAVTNLQIIAATSNSITLSWAAPGDDGSVGTARAYDLRRRADTITETNFASSTTITGQPAPALAGTLQSFTVVGLSAGTLYFFALQTTDDSTNVSPISNVASGSTLPITEPPPVDITPPGAITNLAITAVASNSLELRWTAPGDDEYAGTAAKYDLRFGTSALDESNWNSATPFTNLPPPALAGTTQSVVVTGLTALTTYYFGLKAADESNNVSLLSNIASNTTEGSTNETDITPPAAITDLQIVSMTTNSATLSWTAPGDDGTHGTATTYDLRQRTSAITDSIFSSSTMISGVPAPAAAGTTQTFTVDGLSAGTTYFFALKTIDDATNLSELSNIASGTTPTPPSPALISILRSNSVLVLRWNTEPGRRYQVQTAITVPNAWTNYGSDITASNSTTAIHDAISGSARFYRVLSLD